MIYVAEKTKSPSTVDTRYSGRRASANCQTQAQLHLPFMGMHDAGPNKIVCYRISAGRMNIAYAGVGSSICLHGKDRHIDGRVVEQADCLPATADGKLGEESRAEQSRETLK